MIIYLAYQQEGKRPDWEADAEYARDRFTARVGKPPTFIRVALTSPAPAEWRGLPVERDRTCPADQIRPGRAE